MAGDGSRIGLVFRLLGPLIECVCLIVLMRFGNRGNTLLGLPIEPLLYVGLACGFVLVIVGLFLSRSAARHRREET